MAKRKENNAGLHWQWQNTLYGNGGWRLHNFARDMKEKKMATKKNKCLYTRDDRGNTGTLSGNGVQNFAPFCQRYEKNYGETLKK